MCVDGMESRCTRNVMMDVNHLRVGGFCVCSKCFPHNPSSTCYWLLTVYQWSSWGHHPHQVEYHGVQTSCDCNCKGNWVTVWYVLIIYVHVVSGAHEIHLQCILFWIRLWVLMVHILSCINLNLGTPQHLGLVCAIPRKVKEMVIVLNDMLYLIIDILMHVHPVSIGAYRVVTLLGISQAQGEERVCWQTQCRILGLSNDVFAQATWRSSTTYFHSGL